jgi:hypothetical protein
LKGKHGTTQGTTNTPTPTEPDPARDQGAEPSGPDSGATPAIADAMPPSPQADLASGTRLVEKCVTDADQGPLRNKGQANVLPGRAAKDRAAEKAAERERAYEERLASAQTREGRRKILAEIGCDEEMVGAYRVSALKALDDADAPEKIPSLPPNYLDWAKELDRRVLGLPDLTTCPTCRGPWSNPPRDDNAQHSPARDNFSHPNIKPANGNGTGLLGLANEKVTHHFPEQKVSQNAATPADKKGTSK